LIPSLSVEINNIKNIPHCKLELPVTKGLFAIVGENGSGKSTLMHSLSQLVRKSSLNKLNKVDFDINSFVEFQFQGRTERWTNNGFKWISNTYPNNISFDGFYEGSIFYGTRFIDSQKVSNLLNKKGFLANIVDADDFVKDTLSKILHDDITHYRTLKRLRTRDIAKKYDLEGNPYFLESMGNYISQFNMSSGECMLITLLHFVYNVLIRNNNKTGRNVVFFIDEVELALHPSAINRLVTFLEELTASYELTVYFSTHSSELIRRIKPRNLYLIENEDGKIYITNPCYPSYAIRDIYKDDGFDYLLLVEDELAKKVVYKVLYASTLLNSNLIHVLPSGDWGHTLKLQQDFQKNTVLGTGRQVISILDGDVEDKANKDEKYRALKKLFLPIPSLEKYLYRKLITDNDRDFQKRLGDRFFKTRSIKDVLTDYKNNYKVAEDKKGKNLFGLLTSVLHKTGLNEDEFVIYLCDDIYQDVNFTKFQSALEKMIGNHSTIK